MDSIQKKIILVNPKRERTETYHKMKKLMKEFKGPILEFNAVFPEEYINSSFEEIDIVLRFDETLFIFDCKGTSTYRGEQDRFLAWIEYFNNNISDLYRQGQLILYNIKNDLISIPFLKGIKYFTLFQIQTEGIFSSEMVMSSKGYLNFLKDMKNNKDMGKLK